MHPLSKASLVAAALSASLLSAGCGAGAPSTISGPVGLHLSGSVFGGQQPVIGATIQLYTVGTTATGAASTALITGAPVLTVAGGSFSITLTYSCTNATQVYIVARGGDPGAGVNSASAMAAALGPCSSLTSGTFISINELSTVAAAYALAPFEGTSYISVGASNGSQLGTLGLPNAFLTAAMLASPTQPTGITVPTAELNTLANILASCVNSVGAGSTGCTQLFNVTGATNTFDAAFYIAKNPGAGAVTGLYTLSGSSAPFQPTLATAPTDFSVAVKYTGSGSNPFSGPSGIAIDANGNALVAQQSGNGIVAVSPLSSGLTSSRNVAGSNLSGPQGIAVDTTGYTWVANTGANNVAAIAPYGTDLSTFSSSAARYVTLTPGTSNPTAIATDTFGNAYTVSPADLRIFAVRSTGTVMATSSYPSFAGTGAFALSGAQTLAVGTGTGQSCVFPFISNSSTVSFYNSSPTCVPAGAATNITALNYNAALGSAGFVGVGNGSVAGAPLFDRTTSGTTYFLSSTASTPTALAFDKAGKAFIANNGAVFEYDISGTALSPAAGFGSLSTPQGVAVDPSGNVWTSNSGDNSLSVFIGLAAATVTPIAANLH